MIGLVLQCGFHKWFSSSGIDIDLLHVLLLAAKIDVNVDFTHKLCTSLMFPAFR